MSGVQEILFSEQPRTPGGIFIKQGMNFSELFSLNIYDALGSI